MTYQAYKRLALGLANDFYEEKINTRELLEIVEVDNKLLEKLIDVWYNEGYTDIINSLMLERSKDILERCFHIQV